MNAPIKQPTSPQRLTTDMADRLNADGYLVIKNAAAPMLLEKVAAELDAYYQDYPNSEGFFYGDKTVRFGSVFAKSKASQGLALDPTILSIMDQILGPWCERFQINLTQAIGIKPGETGQIPHRDDEMFPWPHPGTPFMVNCMWALSDFTPDNGGTRIWPRTHKGDFTRDIDPAASISPVLAPGDLLIYLGSCVHGGGANTTKHDIRKGLVISYSLGWLRQSENQYLAYPPEVAKDFPADLRSLIGYSAHRPNLGWVEGQDPSVALQSNDDLLATRSLLTPEQEAMVASFTK